MRKQHKGFLLVDLLVSIGIFSLVFVIAVPSFQLIRDYQYKQFLHRLETLIKTSSNLSILRKKTHLLVYDPTKRTLHIEEQLESPGNYFVFKRISKRDLELPGEWIMRFITVEKRSRKVLGDRLTFYPGGRVENVYIELEKDAEVKTYQILSGDPLKEIIL